MSTSVEIQAKASVQDLLEAGLHFGHQTKRWNPKMKRFIFDERNGIYIIDLIKSMQHLEEAQRFIFDTVARGRGILFVGTKKQAQDILKESAEKLNQFHVTHRWLGGTLTNNQTIRKSVARMHELSAMDSDGRMDALPSKKEAASLRRELTKLRRNLSGLAEMDQLPGAMFVVDVKREAIAVAEANRLNIPVVAIVDTNCDPDPIDFPIPGNDDAIRAIKLIVKVVGDTIQQANNEYAVMAAEQARKRAAEEAEAAARKKAVEAEAKKRRQEAIDKAKAAGALAAKEAEAKEAEVKKAEAKEAEAKEAEVKKAEAKEAEAKEAEAKIAEAKEAKETKAKEAEAKKAEAKEAKAKKAEAKKAEAKKTEAVKEESAPAEEAPAAEEAAAAEEAPAEPVPAEPDAAPAEEPEAAPAEEPGVAPAVEEEKPEQA